MFEMKAALKEQVEELTTKYEVDPFSRDFIFGGNESYARLRNQRFALHSNGHMTVLSAMLRYGFDETRRANVFPSPYHLGSTKRIPQGKQSLVELAKQVRKDKHANRTDGTPISSDPETQKKEFESITVALRAITGTTFSKYEDKQNALRVIYLIDRMMPQSRFTEERSRRLLTFIKTPYEGFSLEARDAYPIPESESNTFLLNDLKAYMAIEIDNETQDRIDSAFNSIIDRVDAIRSHLEKTGSSSGEKYRIIRDHRSIIEIVNTFGISPHDSALPRPYRLDMDLYLHLNRFEFLHFSGAHAEALDAAKPPSPIASVSMEIVEALSELTKAPRTYKQTTVDNFWLDSFPDIANRHAELLLDLIAKALGFRPSKAKYERSVPLAQELLRRTRFFGRGVLPGEPVKVSFRNIVSALCATSQAIKFPTQYRPRVFGDDSQTRSTITPLEVPIQFSGDRPPTEIPEGYLQIWHNRQEWVQHALEGAQEIAELKFSLRKLLWVKFIECVQPNDIGLIEKNLSRLESRLLRVGPDDLDA